MLPSPKKLSEPFMPHQLAWIEAEVAIHDQPKQVVALAEKSVRVAFSPIRKNGSVLPAGWPCSNRT